MNSVNTRIQDKSFICRRMFSVMLFETWAVTDRPFFVPREAPGKLHRGGTGDFGKDGKDTTP